MSRVDFAFGATDRLRAACQVVRKRYLAGQHLVIFCSDDARLSIFDRLLWTFDDVSFVPHVLATDTLAASTPVILTTTAPAPPSVNSSEESWLVNLDDKCPPGFDGFTRILEVVSNRPDDMQAARQRWREYLTAGHTVQGHDLAGRLA